MLTAALDLAWLNELVAEVSLSQGALVTVIDWDGTVLMPGDNGIQALELIKTSHPALTVMMLTAFPSPQYRQRSLQAGAAYFFDKAGEFERVLEVLSQLAGGADRSRNGEGKDVG